MPNNNERYDYLDVLRVLATISVVFLHLSAYFFKMYEPTSLKFTIVNFADAITRWSVPVFFMISGVLFLGRDIDMPRVFKKNILRLVIAYLVWNIFYALNSGDRGASIIAGTIEGHYHMWFIPTMVGLYMCLPILKAISDDTKATKLYLILCFVFVFVVQFLSKVEYLTDSVFILRSIQTFSRLVKDMKMDLVAGYSFYFLLGKYLNDTRLEKRNRLVIYILGTIGFALTIVLNQLSCVKNGIDSYFFNNFDVCVLMQAIGVFVFIKQAVSYKESVSKMWKVIGTSCFGIYLVHPFILERIIRINETFWSEHILTTMVLLGTIVFFVSLLVSLILNKIPIVRKYIV